MHGTEVTFLPSPRIFAMTELDWATLAHRLHDLACRNPGVRIVLTDRRCAVEQRAEMLHEVASEPSTGRNRR